MLPEENRRKLKELCRTRWVERHEAFQVFSDLFLPIFCCLVAIVYSSSSDWNRETCSDAQSLLLAMSQFSFMIALVLSQKILAYTKGLSVKLQGRYVDVVWAHRDIESVKAVISGVLSRVDDFHSQVQRGRSRGGQGGRLPPYFSSRGGQRPSTFLQFTHYATTLLVSRMVGM